MKRSIKFNLIALFVSSLIIVLSVSVFINNVFLESHYINREKSRFESLAKEIQDAFQEKNTTLIEEIEYEAKTSVLVVDNRLNTIVGRRHLEGDIHKKITETSEFPIYTKFSTNEPLLVYVDKFSSGYIILSTPMIVITDNLEITSDFHIITIGLAVFIGFGFMIIFSKLFTKPIIEISSIAESMSKLDFTKKINYTRDDELGALANSINSLSNSLEKNINHLKEEVEFQKVLSRNMSHELKTPISVIKGYVEGVYYGIAETEEEKEQYYKIIINECDRMNNLITEMLDFSKISATNFTLNDFTELNTINIKDEIHDIFSTIFESNDINFTIDCQDFNFNGDNNTIIRVLSNFISNAVKYGNQEEIKLTIRIENEMIIMSVFNTGENIKESKLYRIFDAFYTLDDSRTRENNGHGLGLSIVKSIADLYSGEVFMENKDNGVQATFIFPK